jgi:hypothetical protein
MDSKKKGSSLRGWKERWRRRSGGRSEEGKVLGTGGMPARKSRRERGASPAMESAWEEGR